MDLRISPSVAPQVADKLRVLVVALDDAAAKAQAAANVASGNAFDRWFQETTGTDTAAASARSLAASQAKLAASTRAHVERIIGNDEALKLLREAESSHWADLGDLSDLARMLTARGAATSVAADTARDIGTGASAAGRAILDTGKNALSAVKWLPFVALALAAAVAFVWLKKRAS